MRLIIDGISKEEAKEMLSNQYGSTIWKIINGERCTYPTSKISVRLFNDESKFAIKMEVLNPEFSRIVSKHFWDLI